MRGLGLSASCGGARVTGLAGGGGVRGGPVSALARKKPKPRDDAATPPRKRRSCPPAKTEGFNLRQSVCKSVPCRPNRSAVGTGFSVWQFLAEYRQSRRWLDGFPTSNTRGPHTHLNQKSSVRLLMSLVCLHVTCENVQELRRGHLCLGLLMGHPGDHGTLRWRAADTDRAGPCPAGSAPACTLIGAMQSHSIVRQLSVAHKGQSRVACNAESVKRFWGPWHSQVAHSRHRSSWALPRR